MVVQEVTGEAGLRVDEDIFHVLCDLPLCGNCSGESPDTSATSVAWK